MNIILLNLLVAIAALLVVFTVWGAIHLLTQKRFGDRKTGCKGAEDIMGESSDQVCLCEAGLKQNCEQPCKQDAPTSQTHTED